PPIDILEILELMRIIVYNFIGSLSHIRNSNPSKFTSQHKLCFVYIIYFLETLMVLAILNRQTAASTCFLTAGGGIRLNIQFLQQTLQDLGCFRTRNPLHRTEGTVWVSGNDA